MPTRSSGPEDTTLAPDPIRCIADRADTSLCLAQTQTSTTTWSARLVRLPSITGLASGPSSAQRALVFATNAGTVEASQIEVSASLGLPLVPCMT
jgi:hypothetical protein